MLSKITFLLNALIGLLLVVSVLALRPAQAQQQYDPGGKARVSLYGGTGSGGVGTPSASSSIAITPVVAKAASNVVGKASAGNLYSAYISAGSTELWGLLINATSLPSDGAKTAGTASGNVEACFHVPPNTDVSFAMIGPPMAFSVGVTLAASSTACGTLTASTTPNFLSISAK